MEKIIEQGILYDFYGPLLTEHQQEIYEMIVYDNMSLGEIALDKGISRQAVHDIVKRCDKQLAEYENKLHLIKRFSDNKRKMIEIKSLLNDYSLFSEAEKISDDNKVQQTKAIDNIMKINQEISQRIDDIIEEL